MVSRVMMIFSMCYSLHCAINMRINCSFFKHFYSCITGLRHPEQQQQQQQSDCSSDTWVPYRWLCTMMFYTALTNKEIYRLLWVPTSAPAVVDFEKGIIGAQPSRASRRSKPLTIQTPRPIDQTSSVRSFNSDVFAQHSYTISVADSRKSAHSVEIQTTSIFSVNIRFKGILRMCCIL